MVVDPDGAGFLAQALPDSDSHSTDAERPAVSLIALCGDDRDVAAFKMCDKLSVKLDADLLVVVGRPDMPGDAEFSLSSVVRVAEAARPGRVRISRLPPLPDHPLAALAAEMFDCPEGASV